MDRVQKISFTGYNAPSSEPFRLHPRIMNTEHYNEIPCGKTKD
jgi:hypothetical protein